MRSRRPWLALILAVAAAHPLRAQGTLAGVVLTDLQRPLEGATVVARRTDGSLTRESLTDGAGAFRLAALPAGTYTVTTRRVGFRSAELPAVRLAEGQTLSLAVTLTQAPAQLSRISVVVSPTSVDLTAPGLPLRLDREIAALLPTGRTAASLVALLPGAREDRLWGGASGGANNYQLDGVAINHPGIGGDYLALSTDWIEALRVEGLGAGAEHGDFQGGVVNAVTRTGTNTRAFALRANHESPRLTASNFNLGEQGVEQAGRREIAGEALGPVRRDRLFYFIAGQYVSRDLRSPDLATPAPSDFQALSARQVDARALGKLTWLPASGHRVDVLAGAFGYEAERDGLNGVDDVTALPRVTRPTRFLAGSWSGAPGPRDQFGVRIAGFRAREERRGIAGDTVPAIHVMAAGRQPRLQNAEFTEMQAPSNLSVTGEWRGHRRVWVEHELVAGVTATRGRWRDDRVRNGGLTWRPYPTSDATLPFDPADVTTWRSVASVWGGDIHSDGRVASDAVFLEDRLAIGSRLTVSSGMRFGRWRGRVLPYCGAPAVLPGCRDFEAVRATAWDPRIGLAWDVTGRGDFAAKAHWGRYHQGMHSLYFDRAQGANVYADERLYYLAPTLTSSTQTFTAEERDAAGSAFRGEFTESRRNIAGRVEGYRQPFVDQTMLAIERSFAGTWKAEVMYAHRRNGDIVGLRDRNLSTNYLVVRDVHVEHRFVRGRVLDPAGNRLVLPEVYVPNFAVRDFLLALWQQRQFPATIFGIDTAEVLRSTWSPDVVLTTIPEARRSYDQLSVMVRTVQRGWRAEASLVAARLEGNVPGMTGHGSTGTRFSAGAFVNPNEGINGFGRLPGSSALEAKGWVIASLPFSLAGGLTYTHTLGERFAPTYTMNGEYAFFDDAGDMLPRALFEHSFGQPILIEARGARHYASRAILDAHIEWRAPRQAVITFDLYNVLGEDALVAVNTDIAFQSPAEPSTWFGAPRLRVAPRTLRIGVRFEDGMARK